MPALASLGEIVRSEDATLGNHDVTWRQKRRQALRCRQRRFKCFQVAVVDANEPRFEPKRPRKLRFIVDLDKNVHAEANRNIFEFGGAAIVDRSHDDENAISAGGSRLQHLINVKHEVLAQHRERTRGAGLTHIVERALERRRVSQYRQAGGAARRIGRGQRRRIKIFPYQSLRRTGLFDFGYECVIARRQPPFDRH